MRSFLLLLCAWLADISRRVRETLSLMIENPGFAPALELKGRVHAQVIHVPSIFAKAPCSVTGGSA